MTHRRLVAMLAECAPLEVQLKARLVKFISKAHDHKNDTIKHITQQAFYNPMSVCGRNWRDHAHFDMKRLFISEIYEKWFDSIAVEDQDKCSVLKEMIFIREGWVSCDIFTTEEVVFMIEDLCIN